MDSSVWTERLLQIMIDADRGRAGKLIDEALAAGLPQERILSDVLDPVLGQLGAMWETESVSLAQAFVAAKIAEDVLMRGLPDETSGAALAIKGRVVLGNIEDDFHSLGRRIVASFLRASGWEVHDLGNDVLPEQFVEKALEVDAALIGASAMMQTTALNIRKLRELIDSRGLRDRMRLAVGGAVFNLRPELVQTVGGDGMARSAAHADALLTELQRAVAKGGRA